MPAPAHIKITHSGAMTPTEVWSITHAIDARLAQFSDPVLGTATLQGLAVICRGLFGTIWTSLLDDLAGNAVTYQTCRATQYLGTGLTFAYGESSGTALPGTGPITHPPQIAAVVSLRTGVVGPRARGRMYFPATGMTLDGDGAHVTTADVGTLLGGFVAYFNEVNALVLGSDFQGTGRVAVASDAAEAMFVVTRVQVGNVFDTQRRRREDIAEVYSQSLLA